MTKKTIDKSPDYLAKYQPSYGYYYDDNIARGIPPRCGKTAFQQYLNCSDEIIPGSHKRANRLQQLKQEKILIGSKNFTKQYSKIISEMHELLKEEILLTGDLSEQQANHWINRNVNFNHVQKHVIDDKEYLSIDPIIKKNYREDLKI